MAKCVYKKFVNQYSDAMKKNINIFIASVSFFLALLLSGCAQKEMETEKEIIRIGLLKDPSQTWMDPGAILAVEKINELGGVLVNGKRIPVKLIIEEMKSVEAEAVVSSMLKLINQDSVCAIFGPNFSKQSLPASKIAEKLKVPLLVSYSSHPDVTLNKKYVFRLGFSDTLQANIIAGFVKKDLKINKVGILYEVSDEYSRNLAESFIRIFEKSGGIITAAEKYTFDNKNNFMEQLKRIGTSNAQAIFLPNYALEIKKQAELIKKLNLSVKIIGGDAANPAGEDFANVEIYNTARIPPDKERITEYFKLFSEKRKVVSFDTLTAISFDGINLILEAIKRAGSFNPDSIQKSLYNFAPFQGVNSVYEYRSSGDPNTGMALLHYANKKLISIKRIYPIKKQ